jgi:hypothetical protein
VSAAEFARGREITEVLHYTSERGAMGTVMKKALLSREQVENDSDIAFIFEGVWERKDPEWVDYISLSLSRINLDLYRRSRKRFPDYWWAIFSFDIEVLDHDGVWFATTNNTYPVCERAQGEAGLAAMFAPTVPWGWRGSVKTRSSGMPEAWTTCEAAEVLYPQSIPLEYLQRIYVPGAQHRRLVQAWAEVYGARELTIEVKPGSFS